MSTQNSTRISPTDAGYAALTQGLAVQPRRRLRARHRRRRARRFPASPDHQQHQGAATGPVRSHRADQPRHASCSCSDPLSQARTSCSCPPASKPRRWLVTCAARCFFMDKVTVTDPGYVRWRIMGPNAWELLHKTGWPADEIAGDAWQNVTAYSSPAKTSTTYLASSWPRPRCAGVRLARGDAAPRPHTSWPTASPTRRRVELERPRLATKPRSTTRWKQDWRACSDNKGCYTGQEIIARQVTYDKVTKTLVGLLERDDIQPGPVIRGRTQRRRSHQRRLQPKRNRPSL